MSQTFSKLLSIIMRLCSKKKRNGDIRFPAIGSRGYQNLKLEISSDLSLRRRSKNQVLVWILTNPPVRWLFSGFLSTILGSGEGRGNGCSPRVPEIPSSY